MRTISILSGVAVAVGVAVGTFVAGYMYHSYLQAQAEVAACEADGLLECHIERDGTEYNVYGRVAE